MEGIRLYQGDAQDVYEEEVREKSKVARSAHCKNRRATGAFQNERSEGEIRRMAGPVKTYNLNKPMNYADFKAMPKDIQEQYLRGLVDKYKVGPSALGRMLGVDPCMIADRLHNLGVTYGRRASVSGTKRFETEFLGVQSTPAEEAVPVPTQAADSTPSVPPEAKIWAQHVCEYFANRERGVLPASVEMQDVELTFCVDFCATTIAERLDGLFRQGQRVRVTLQIEAVD